MRNPTNYHGLFDNFVDDSMLSADPVRVHARKAADRRFDSSQDLLYACAVVVCLVLVFIICYIFGSLKPG